MKIEGIDGMIVIFYHSEEIYNYPTLLEGHGIKEVNENEIEWHIDSVELVINGIPIEVKELLSLKQIECITDALFFKKRTIIDYNIGGNKDIKEI